MQLKNVKINTKLFFVYTTSATKSLFLQYIILISENIYLQLTKFYF